MQRPIQIVLTVAFAGLLAAPVVLQRLRPRGAPAPGAAAQFGFHFQEVAKRSGIDFTHRAPRLDPRLDHIMPQIASMGAGAAVADFDRDGWNDLYVTNSGEGSLNRLYRNRGDGSFEDVAGALGVADVNRPELGVSMGSLWGDYDNDGFEDLFVYKWGRPELFRNEGGRRFARVTEQVGLPKWINANSAVWLDYDRDGRLDLFIGGYYHERINLWHLENTRMMPESFEYAKNGGRKYLLRNVGGRFEDVTEAAGIRSRRWALACAAADLRGTGFPDLVIANDYGVSELFLNQGGRGFRDAGAAAGIGARPKSGMNASFGDIRSDGQFAIYVSNITEPGTLIQGNNLWVPRGGSEPKYDELAEDFGVAAGGWSFGAQFGDLNNDGFNDLFLTNGYVSASRNESYWYDYSKITGGNSAIISDARNWPAMRNTSLAGYQQKRVWMNEGGRKFVDVAPLVGVMETYDGRAVALADFWNRGMLDAAVAHQRGPLLLYRNQVTAPNGWVQFELEGSRSNRSAIGAQVRVFWGGRRQLQEISGGSGFCAQGQRRLHFGLGPGARIDRVEIRWPSGRRQSLSGVETGKLHRLKEPA